MKSLKTYKFHHKFHVLSDLRMCANHPEYSIRLLYSFSLRGSIKNKGYTPGTTTIVFHFHCGDAVSKIVVLPWCYHGNTTVKPRSLNQYSRSENETQWL